MVDRNALPIGIRLHNPGCLRASCAPSSKTHLTNGYATFDNDLEGLVNLAWCVGQFYFHLKLNTIASFLSRYAPASENDLLRYEQFIAKWIGYTSNDIASRDLDLDGVPNVAHLMMGIVRYECGVPRPALLRGPEWFTMAEVMRAARISQYWAGH